MMETKESKQRGTFLTRLRRSFLHADGDRQTDSRIRQTYQSLSHWHDFQIKLFWEGIVVGIFSGLVISFFRWALTQAEMLRIVAGIGRERDIAAVCTGSALDGHCQRAVRSREDRAAAVGFLYDNPLLLRRSDGFPLLHIAV